MLLRLNRIVDAQRQIYVLLADEMIYTTDTHKLYIGDGETVGGIDLAESFVNGSESFISERVTEAFQQNGIIDVINQAIDQLKTNVSNDINFIKKTLVQDVLASKTSEITESYSDNFDTPPDFRLTCLKGSLDNPVELQPGDSLFGISFGALQRGDYVSAANIQAHWQPSADLTQSSCDTRLVFTVHKNNDQLSQFQFDHTGTLSAPSIRTGPYTTQERDSLTPAVGTIIYNSTENRFQGYQNTNGTTLEWVNLS